MTFVVFFVNILENNDCVYKPVQQYLYVAVGIEFPI